MKQARKKNKKMATPTGFEPVHVTRNRFLVDPLNRSGTVSDERCRRLCPLTTGRKHAITSVGSPAPFPWPPPIARPWIWAQRPTCTRCIGRQEVGRSHTRAVGANAVDVLDPVPFPPHRPTDLESCEARIICYDVSDPHRVDDLLEPDTARFDSRFETGNLAAAVRIRSYDASGTASIHDQVRQGPGVGGLRAAMCRGAGGSMIPSGSRLRAQVYELYLRHDVCYPSDVCWWSVIPSPPCLHAC